MEDKTLLLLIDFEGVPQLADDPILEEIRYSHLKKLLFTFPAKSLFIVTDSQPWKKKVHELSIELTTGQRAHSHTWHTLNDEDCWPSATNKVDVNYIKAIAREKYKFDIQNVVVAGNNLAGCVYKAKPYSAKYWAKEGHFTQIILPMCGDYETFGIGPEKYMRSFAMLYKNIRDDNLSKLIEVIYDMNRMLYFGNGTQLSRRGFSGKRNAAWHTNGIPKSE